MKITIINWIKTIGFFVVILGTAFTLSYDSKDIMPTLWRTLGVLSSLVVALLAIIKRCEKQQSNIFNAIENKKKQHIQRVFKEMREGGYKNSYSILLSLSQDVSNFEDAGNIFDKYRSYVLTIILYVISAILLFFDIKLFFIVGVIAFWTGVNYIIISLINFLIIITKRKIEYNIKK